GLEMRRQPVLVTPTRRHQMAVGQHHPPEREIEYSLRRHPLRFAIVAIPAHRLRGSDRLELIEDFLADDVARVEDRLHSIKQFEHPRVQIAVRVGDQPVTMDGHTLDDSMQREYRQAFDGGEERQAPSVSHGFRSVFGKAVASQRRTGSDSLELYFD